MPSKGVEEFGRTLVEHVRDETVEWCDIIMQPDVRNSAKARRWRAAMDLRDPGMITKVLVPDIVDSVICNLLEAIDNGAIGLTFRSKAGEVDLTEDGLGELEGWYMAESDSW